MKTVILNDYTVESKAMPHSDYFEKLVLGHLIQSHSMKETASWLHKDLFYVDDHQSLYLAILKVYKSSGDVNFHSLRAVINDDLIPLLIDISKMAHEFDRHYKYVLTLKEFFIKRKILSGGYWLTENYNQDVYEVGQVISKLSDTINNELSLSTARDGKSLVMETIEELENKETHIGIRSGIGQLDGSTMGFQKGELAIIAARPSIGKTTLAISIFKNIFSDGAIPNFFSLETKDKELMRKIISNEAGIPYSKIRNKDIKNWGEINDTVAKLYEKEFYIHDKPGITIEELGGQVKQMCNMKKCDIVFVDYLQLMNIKSSDEKKQNRESQIRYISNELKNIATKNNIPVVALAQLNRELEKRGNKRPLLSDLRDSGSIEQDADLVLFLYREAYYDTEADEHDAEISISKHRNGKTGLIRIRCDLEYMRFYD